MRRSLTRSYGVALTMLAVAALGASGCSDESIEAVSIVNVDCDSSTTSQIQTPGGRSVPMTVTVACYDVSGRTVEDVRASIDVRRGLAPKAEDGFDAATHWNFRINWTFRTATGACSVAALRPTLEVTFTYPRLRPADGASQDLAKRWNAYIAALQQHEAGHQQNGIDATSTAVDGIAALRAPTCAELEQLAEARIAQATATGDAADRAYDAATDHGSSQGANLP